MDAAVLRSLTKQLAEDLAFLEEHARARHPMEASRLRVASGIVRNVVGPWFEKRAARPLHVAVVGGAGAGKSTIVNFLCGGPVAEANPQAGFTRHPVAYVASGSPAGWADHLGFLGPLRRLSRPGASNIDEDVYQVRVVGPESRDAALLANLVVWDCPDMTTTAAGGYVSRLLEVAALADLLIYVASDERYNDEAPTQFLRVLLEAGKKVVVCLVKVRDKEAAAFVDHFKKEVGARLPAPPEAIVTIPQLNLEQLQDPVGKTAERARLVAEVVRLTASAEAARLESVRGGIEFLKKRQADLEGVARRDLAALEGWQTLVRQGQAEFTERYRREYLRSEPLRVFDEAQARLMETLELPGLGRLLSALFHILRTPVRLLRGAMRRAGDRPLTATLPEQPILEAAFAGWLDQLRKEALRRAPEHALWAHVQAGFAADLATQARERFEQRCRAFQAEAVGEINAAARAVCEGLYAHPGLLGTVRVLRFAVDLAIIPIVLYYFDIGLLSLVLIPLAVSATELLVEWAVRLVVDQRREDARARQALLLTHQVAAPVGDWLAAWPRTGGSTFERLQQALDRLGPAILELEKALP